MTETASAKQWTPENLEALTEQAGAALELVDYLCVAVGKTHAADLSGPEKWLLLGAVEDALTVAGTMVGELVETRMRVKESFTKDDLRLLEGVGQEWRIGGGGDDE